MNKIKVYENEDEYIEFSAESAEILLCKQLLNPLNFDYVPFIINNFDPNWLRTEERKSLFKIAKKYYEVREAIPSKETMHEIFKNKKYESSESELLDEYNKIVDFNEKDLDEKLVANTIKTFIKSKSIYFAILDKVQVIESTGEIGDLLSRFEKIIQLDVSDDLGVEYFENLDNHANELVNRINKVPFGLTDLDKYTCGGLPMNDTCLFIVMAQPGLGKSTVMANIAYNWILKNKKVLVVSLEMSENMYSKRFDALFTDMSMNSIYQHIPELKARVRGTKAGVPKALLQIKEFPTGTLTSAMLKQYIKKLRQQKNFVPDIIFIDYLNIMKPNGANAGALSLYEKGGRIAEELRAISSEMKIPVFTAVQSNRQSSGGGYAGENIDMSNVSESAGITATADALIALYQLDGERENNRINMKILKNRLGGYIGVHFPLYCDYSNESLKISDWNKNDSINDDILGTVQETDEFPDRKTKKHEAESSHIENSIEEI